MTTVHWSLLKTFLNNKMLVIPPLFYENNFEINFKNKVELFSFFFAKQFYLVKSDARIFQSLHYVTDKPLWSAKFSNADILKTIHNLDPNKAHDQDKISIPMFKICLKSIYRLLEIIFKDYLEYDILPSVWKKANIVPVHKKVIKII